jgi:transcription elongation factor GreB
VSKAFTKEEATDAPLVLSRRAPLPDGVPNYVTAAGLAAYRAELDALLRERAALMHLEPASDVPHPLAALNLHIAELESRIGSAELVELGHEPGDEVRFGARVTVRNPARAEHTYQIVGVDEADAPAGRIAFVAPLARALLGKRVGDAVVVRAPHGDDELEVLAIHYD